MNGDGSVIMKGLRRLWYREDTAPSRRSLLGCTEHQPPARRIAIFTSEIPPVIGGISTYVDQLAKAAAEQGHNVTVIAPRLSKKPPVDTAMLPYKLDYIAIRPHAPGIALLNSVLTTLSIAKYLKRRRFDIVHLASDRVYEGGRVVRALTGYHYIVTVHGSDILKLSKSRRTRIFRPFAQNGPDRVFTLSKFCRQLLLTHYPGVDEKVVSVVPPGVDAFWLSTEAPQQRSSSSVSQDRHDSIVILLVARVEPRKGHDLVIEAISRVPPAIRSRLVFECVGPTVDHAYALSLDQLAVELDVRLARRGKLSQEEVRRRYASAAVVCMPGKSAKQSIEGFGLAFLEAAAQGVPSIASRLGGMDEAVIHNVTGLLVEPDNPAELASAISRLILDKDLHAKLSSGAREFARNFTWANVAMLTYPDVSER